MGILGSLDAARNEATIKSSTEDAGVKETYDRFKFDGAVGDAKYEEVGVKDAVRAGISGFLDPKGSYQERQEIREGLQELDAELFELEQSGEVGKQDLEGVKDQYEALKGRVDDLPKSVAELLTDKKGFELKSDVLKSGFVRDGGFDEKLEQLGSRLERLENAADGKDVPDRVPDGAVRVDHHYGRGDDTLMDTSMVPLGKDADGFEQFVAYSPTEQAEPKAYYRDEAGNFTTNRNEAVQEFDGVATDPSILPDNAILDDKGNYWRPTGADKDGAQTFQPIRDGGDIRALPAIYQPFYQDADGNFSIKKGEDAISAKDFEKSQWEPQLPEGAVAVNADGDGKVDYHMVSIGADESGQERYVAVQQDYSSTRPDQQIYTRDEDGNFQTLDGEPMEALEQPAMSYAIGHYGFEKGVPEPIDVLFDKASASSEPEAED